MPSGLEKHLQRARKHLEKGKVSAALEEFLQALELAPNDEFAKQSAADLSLQLGDNPRAAALLSNLFDTQAARNDSVRAIANYRKLARIIEPSAAQRLRFAQFLESSSYREARDAYRDAYSALQQQGSELDQFEALQGWLRCGSSTELLTEATELASHLGNKRLAAEYYLRLAETNSGYDADSCYEAAYRADPTNVRATEFYVQALLRAGEHTTALPILEEALKANSSESLSGLYVSALAGAARFAEATKLVLERYSHAPDPNRPLMLTLIEGLCRNGEHADAVTVARSYESNELHLGRRAQMVDELRDIAARTPSVEFLEYLAQLFNSVSREADYSATLQQLVQLYLNAGNYARAADLLERAIDVDPYEAVHAERVTQLKGKIDAGRWRSLAMRLRNVGASINVDAEDVASTSPVTTEAPESMSVDDLMVEAEICLRYGMKAKAAGMLQRIRQVSPNEELTNLRLRELLAEAGFKPIAANTAANTSTDALTNAPAATASETLTKVTEIVANLHQQTAVKPVLLTLANEVGAYWKASRCLAALIAPGKPPSAALEYCAPSIAQSSVQPMVKLLLQLQYIVMERGGFVSIQNAKYAPELEAVRESVQQLGIMSLLAFPLKEADQHVGLLVLEDCTGNRVWEPSTITALKNVADQGSIAVSHVRLRSLMQSLAVTDQQSGLLKRTSYLEVLMTETQRALQQQYPLTVLLLQFSFPQQSTIAEDRLAPISRAILPQLRQNDIAVRYDESTIALTLPETDSTNTALVVNKLRKVLSHLHTQITAGIAQVQLEPSYEVADIVTEAVNRADEALLQAMQDAKGRVCALPPPQLSTVRD
ncbi:MAG TPA: diguanylate cyclase [Terriglobales bacterium]